MKPTSIVFLVLSLLLIVAGVITCSVARDIALTDNYPLFSDTEDGGAYSRHTFSAADVSKIELLLSDAEINIIGGADECAIELYHFHEGLYSFTSSANVVSLDEIPDLKSLLSFKSSFSFSGLRYYLRPRSETAGQKIINIYLTSDSALRILNIEANSCTLQADGIYTQFDLTLRADRHAELRLSDYRTACAFSVSAKTLDAEMFSSYVHDCTVHADTVQLRADELYFDDMSLNAQSGSLYIRATAGLSRYGCDLRGTGKFILLGQETPLPYTCAPPSEKAACITAELGRADLTLDEIID